MTALSIMKDWLATYEGIPAQFSVDWTDQIPSNGGIFPSGLVEVDRRTDILGNITVTNQYNFGLYYVFTKAPGDEDSALANQEWVSKFQEWVQEQSVRGLAPAFGDVPTKERITAQNGVLYDATAEGLGTYMVQVSVQFVKEY